MKKISICVPAYSEEDNIQALYTELTKVWQKDLSGYTYEIVFVNDGSKDNTLSKMQELGRRDERVKVIDLSKNYGKEIAMLAGLDHCSGDAAVIMDSDLQHPPELISKMVELWELGYQDVYGRRVVRKKEPWLKIKLSQIYYKLLSFISQTKIENGIGDFRLLDRECINALIAIRDKERYTKGLYNLIGYKKVSIDFIANERFSGETKWTFKDLFKLALDGITSSSVKPLKLAIYAGFLMLIPAFFYFIYTFVRALSGKTADVPGYSSLMIVILILGGIQLISIGILGEYIGKIFVETKKQPPYFINKKNSKL
ncbi:glycosyltransferase family 2 protein [Vagococcus acidifermentans]|uniref:Glycosyltransferase n=1 Tax=Vagococcus acidifermentans TaxID=564710 RepID=A0A430APR8_9ENTE|nr:glycosyltransferase family 2 protein [Vagococcus acidifermentans]RSU10065.1 glycosyltransferase [Vagococcus acidifermentans]